MKKITLLFALLLCTLGFSQNLITNGDFENGSTGWSGNSANAVTEGGNTYNAANVAIAGNPWDANLSYVLSIPAQGAAYKLTFKAWSDTSRPLIAGIGLNQDPWTNTTQTVTLTTEPQVFVLNLTANFASTTSRIIFDMGNATGFVGIDNVVLEAVTTTCNNGVQDGDETGIDCGGSCTACLVTPLVHAPMPPARPTADVVSIYGDAYTNINFDNFDAGWCGGAATTEVLIDGNKTLQKNTGVSCQGIDFSTHRQNLTDFTYLHFDFYVTDTDLVGDVFSVKLVNFNGTDKEQSALEVTINGGTTPQLVANQWVSVDVPITALGGIITNNLARNDVAQIGITTAKVDHVWYDNIYLHKNTTLGTTQFEKSNVKMYPNPVKNMLTIDANSTIKKVSVYNVLGQEVLSRTPKSNSTTVQTSALQKGVYIVKTDIDGKVSTTKIIKE
ncbi:T9SS type A sorting domain-containing protein [Flavobacterium restrictum]|uniref:T9SS type A sorting domain-containing protein n=1 Tax=Flavobacterium restrictum TaxID=2594428 RepID=A0A553DUB0_9FLAO|nr:T9SS type A sorting domain-containing protein [Flavobacterium restrictum]TRX36351.1 T9SS type A sorting domain-containing protein [Flavobacterium restrictum]